MAESNNKLIVMIATLIFSAIGYIIGVLVQDILNDQAASQTGIIKDILDLITTPGLLTGLIWLLICIIVYIGVSKVINGYEHVSPISLFFLLIWLGAVFGIVIGIIIWTLIRGSQVTLDLDLLINSLAFSLTPALGPSFAAALSISTKGK